MKRSPSTGIRSETHAVRPSPEPCRPVALSRDRQKSVLGASCSRYPRRVAHKWRDVFIAWSITFIAFSGRAIKGIYFVEPVVLQIMDSISEPFFAVRVV
jgi:hypothetical protein